MRDECLAYAACLKQAGILIHARALAAPDWPDTLQRVPCPEAPPDWVDAVRSNIADFFAAVTPGPDPGSRSHRGMTMIDYDPRQDQPCPRRSRPSRAPAAAGS